MNASTEPIAALAFTPDAQELLAVHAPRGALARWRITDSLLLNTVTVGPVGVVAAALDGAGRWVATAAGSIAPAIEVGLAVSIKGYRVFDTASGAVLFDSQPQPDFPFDLRLADVALSPDGHWIARVSSGSISIRESVTGIIQKDLIISGGGDLGWSFEQTTAAFDASGEWVGFMADDGTVRLWAWRQPDAELVLNMGTREPALALAIDPMHRYLAAVTTKSLVMQRMGSWWPGWFGLPGLLDVPVPAGPAAGLTFSPDGTLWRWARVRTGSSGRSRRAAGWSRRRGVPML